MAYLTHFIQRNPPLCRVTFSYRRNRAFPWVFCHPSPARPLHCVLVQPAQDEGFLEVSSDAVTVIGQRQTNYRSVNDGGHSLYLYHIHPD